VNHFLDGLVCGRAILEVDSLASQGDPATLDFIDDPVGPASQMFLYCEQFVDLSNLTFLEFDVLPFSRPILLKIWVNKPETSESELFKVLRSSILPYQRFSSSTIRLGFSSHGSRLGHVISTFFHA
jgi:hypothetical protein